MILNQFEALNYRNIQSCNISFEKGVNLLIGDNAQGKTNTLEGIYYFARGKSFRSVPDENLLMFGKDQFLTKIHYSDKNREQSLSFEYSKNKRIRIKNGYPIKSLSEMLGSFRAILFYPENLSIVKGSPQNRRDFLNVAIMQVNSQYIQLYSQYLKILENRNSILKNAQKGLFFDQNELEAWSEQLAIYASKIFLIRKDYINGIKPFAKEFLNDLSNMKETLDISYYENLQFNNEKEFKDYFNNLFNQHLKEEIKTGYTLYGIHRDDLEINISSISSKNYASQGQQRSIVLALKLAEGEYQKKITGDYPVFLFDDVLSELDDHRKKYLLENSKDKQIIITACDPTIEIAGSNKIIVEGGTYVSSYR